MTLQIGGISINQQLIKKTKQNIKKQKINVWIKDNK